MTSLKTPRVMAELLQDDIREYRSAQEKSSTAVRVQFIKWIYTFFIRNHD